MFLSHPLWVILILVDATTQAVEPIKVEIHTHTWSEEEAPGELVDIALAEELVENVANLLLGTALAFMAFICSPEFSFMKFII